MAGQDVSGMDRAQVEDLVTRRAATATVTISVEGTTLTVPLGDLAQVDASATAGAAVDGNASPWRLIRSLVSQRETGVVAHTDPQGVTDLLHRLNSSLASPPQDATVSWDEASGSFVVAPGVPGSTVGRGDLEAAVQDAADVLADARSTLEPVQGEPEVTTAEAQEAAQAATAMLSTDLSVSVGERSHTPSASQKAAWIEFPLSGGTVVPTVSAAKVGQWVDTIVAKVDRAPVNGVNDVDSDGDVLQLARPPLPGRTVDNAAAVTASLVQGLQSGQALTSALTWTETPAGTDERVVPSGPERFAYRARGHEKWIDVNLTDSTLTTYEGREVVHGPVLVNHGDADHPTSTGTYRVSQRQAQQDVGCSPEESSCQRDVPWVVSWDQGALHGAPDTQDFGVGTDGSAHGYVTMPVADAQAVWDWSEVGTVVVVHD